MLQKVTNKSGFSLVELMVVVAIIGILASLAIPQVTKFQAKARQSEAKSMLSTIYSGEKAFYAEYSAYHSAFQAIGFSPEGSLRYEVGFRPQTVVGTTPNVEATGANGYNTTVAIGAPRSTRAFCGASGTFAAGCTILNGTNNALPVAITAGVADGLAGAFDETACIVDITGAAGGVFTACAHARVYQTNVDVWTITQEKKVTNQTNGIP